MKLRSFLPIERASRITLYLRSSQVLTFTVKDWSFRESNSEIISYQWTRGRGSPRFLRIDDVSAWFAKPCLRWRW